MSLQIRYFLSWLSQHSTLPIWYLLSSGTLFKSPKKILHYYIIVRPPNVRATRIPYNANYILIVVIDRKKSRVSIGTRYL